MHDAIRLLTNAVEALERAAQIVHHYEGEIGREVETLAYGVTDTLALLGAVEW
jgi:hypothetical protein